MVNVVAKTAGVSFEAGDDRARLIISADQTDGRYSMLEWTVAAGEKLPEHVPRDYGPHLHRRWARKALEVFESRLGLVTRQLERFPYLAGETFTAADISVTYALEFARRTGAAALGKAEKAYIARTSGREAYKRAMETCQATRAWAAESLEQ